MLLYFSIRVEFIFLTSNLHDSLIFNLDYEVRPDALQLFISKQGKFGVA